jgi:hypothetical protein
MRKDRLLARRCETTGSELQSDYATALFVAHGWKLVIIGWNISGITGDDYAAGAPIRMPH